MKGRRWPGKKSGKSRQLRESALAYGKLGV